MDVGYLMQFTDQDGARRYCLVGIDGQMMLDGYTPHNPALLMTREESGDVFLVEHTPPPVVERARLQMSMDLEAAPTEAISTAQLAQMQVLADGFDPRNIERIYGSSR